MKALSGEDFLKAEGMEDGECQACGGKLREAELKNVTEAGVELPRFYCGDCGEIYEQTDDFY